jgi:hypothetical protein
MDIYVIHALFSSVITCVTFDLWMSQNGFDIFALVMNFIDDAWVPKHVNDGIVESPNIANVVLVEIVKPLLAKFQFTHKIVAYVKDKGSNLSTLITAFSIIVNHYSWRHHLKGFVLDMYCLKLVSMPPMMLSFALARKKCL